MTHKKHFSHEKVLIQMYTARTGTSIYYTLTHESLNLPED